MPLESLGDAAFANLGLFEKMYEAYLKDPASVEYHWQKIFETFEKTGEFPKQEVKYSKKLMPAIKKPLTVEYQIPKKEKPLKTPFAILRLMDAYRTYGHLAAHFNPFPSKIAEPKQLSLEQLGFERENLSELFPTCGLIPKAEAPLLDILNALKMTYCGKIGIEYMGLQSIDFERWIQEQIEPTRFNPNFSVEKKQAILHELNKAELLESFIHTKYPGQKRFSLEGAETLIPMLSELVDLGAQFGTEEFIIGMAHRGRLNVLSNILNKSYADIFSEFDENYFSDTFEGSGDVKYHKGFLSDVQSIQGHQVKIVLTPNPSHLESVDAVVEGQVFAKQIKNQDEVEKVKSIPLLIHGDASLSGQGIVYETLQLNRLKGYSTGGTIHLVVNNHIGFTTLPKDARSTRYCTDIAKTFGAPVFHVNAEDPEASVFVAQLAMKIRHQFHCDVFIDLNCYRKYGHNEGDEPFFTQPMEYRLIRSKKSIRELYLNALIEEGILEKFMVESLENEFKEALQKAMHSIKVPGKEPQLKMEEEKEAEQEKLPTAVSKTELREVAQKICAVPKEFHIHPKLEKLLKERLAMIYEESAEHPIDWGMGELLAYGTLLWEKIPIRLAGQDVARGTFSHRHSVWMDQETDKAYFPLTHLKKEQGRCDIINSPLSEFAALGFEFGYSIAYPETLVIWEAQFGDFANGAQVIIDQYIATSEQKWGQRSALVMLLPHGYEGQGPEHSSGRMERFLTLSGDQNIVVTNPTTPAQFFHLIRRQMICKLQKPLIVFTPKVLLRHPACISHLADFENGTFEEIIDEEIHPKKVKKLAFCSGKFYYDLTAYREQEKNEEIAFVRVEQLYPLNMNEIKKVLEKYTQVSQYIWVQEEPKNMGAWNYIQPKLQKLLPKGKELVYIGRQRSASPAVGSYALHKKEHGEIMDQLFTKEKSVFSGISSLIKG